MRKVVAKLPKTPVEQSDDRAARGSHICQIFGRRRGRTEPAWPTVHRVHELIDYHGAEERHRSADLLDGMCRSIVENVFTKVARVPNFEMGAIGVAHLAQQQMSRRRIHRQ